MAGQSRNKSKSKAAGGGWKKSTATELLLPSGETALVKRPGIQAFLKKGVIPDSLAPIVQAQINKAQGKRPVKGGDASDKIDIAALMEDPEKLAAILELVDTVLVDVVVQPKVAAAPANPDDRRDDVFYPDEVDLEDKMFIFNFAVGGTRDLERFRSESDGALASVDSVAGVQVAP